MKSTSLVVTLLAFLLPISAAQASGGLVAQISRVQSYSGHSGILVVMAVPHQNPDSCPSASFYIYPDNGPRAEFVQSMLLSAVSSGKTVEIVFDGCYENYPKIVHVAVRS